MKEITTTFFARAERDTFPNLIKEHNIFLENKLLCEVMDAVPDIILILNHSRQIIYSNHTAISLLEEDNFNSILGMRPGELLNCVHSIETPGGCGTTEFCKTCGAVNAILNSQKGIADVQECRITQNGSLEALDLKVFATPLSINGYEFTIFSVLDISHEKRKTMLEKIFLHDIINTVSGVRGAAQLLGESDPSDKTNYVEMIINLSDSLLEEIVAQREIASAESNDLKIEITTFNSLDLLKEITRFYSIYEAGKDKLVEIDLSSELITINSDRVLLRRVLGNMIKNALEAIEPGGVVNTGCNLKGNIASFWVHNNTFIPRDYQLQIFQRSFTTKGTGRGIGTYSIKLLTEKYLKGKASLTSNAKDGTIFTVACPINLKN